MKEGKFRQAGFTVHGRVQGVGFRWWARTTAEELGLAGWVRNRRDGTVEAHVRGSDEDVAAFRARLEEGPPGARVDSVQSEPSSVPIPDGSFRITH